MAKEYVRKTVVSIAAASFERISDELLRADMRREFPMGVEVKIVNGVIVELEPRGTTLFYP